MAEQVELNPDSHAVAQNLENADKVQDLQGEVHASTEAHGGPVTHAPEPSVFGLNATAWVSLAMAVFFAILIWKKVPALIGQALDDRIAGIRSQRNIRQNSPMPRRTRLH